MEGSFSPSFDIERTSSCRLCFCLGVRSLDALVLTHPGRTISGSPSGRLNLMKEIWEGQPDRRRVRCVRRVAREKASQSAAFDRGYPQTEMWRFESSVETGRQRSRTPTLGPGAPSDMEPPASLTGDAGRRRAGLLASGAERTTVVSWGCGGAGSTHPPSGRCRERPCSPVAPDSSVARRREFCIA
jgi:hypothetical protein